MSASTADPWSVTNVEAQAPDARSLAAARELLNDDTFTELEATAGAAGWSAICRGTTDVYRVAVRLMRYGFACQCSCPSRKEPCKHALAFLLHLQANPELRTTAPPARRGAVDFEGLLHAIFSTPEDDTARLVFADYLDENDQTDRAALIRAQCELSRLRYSAPPAALAEEEETLVARITANIGKLPEDFDLDFRRGFVWLRAGPEAFTSAAPLPARVANLLAHGWVESVRVLARFSSIATDTYSVLRKAGELDFSHREQGDVALVQLAAEMPVGVEGQRLARVRVHPNDEALFRAYCTGTRAPRHGAPPDWGGRWTSTEIPPAQLERLLRAGRVEGVTELSFSGPSFDDHGAEVLAAGEGLELQTLRLGSETLGPVGAGALAAAEWFPRLDALTVSGCPFGDEGVAALGRPPGACALTNLHLLSVGANDAGLVALAVSRRFSRLTSLELWGDAITNVGVAALLGSEHFPALALVTMDLSVAPEYRLRLALDAREHAERPVLELRFGNIRVVRQSELGGGNTIHRVTVTRADAESLAGAKRLESVTALTVEESTLDVGTATALAAALAPDRWRALDLTGCDLGAKPAAVVERFCTGHRLTTLDLTRTGLKYADVYKLALCPALDTVKVLDLSANPMGTGGLEAILGSPHLRGVERFVLKELNLSQRDRARFQKEFGKRAEF